MASEHERPGVIAGPMSPTERAAMQEERAVARASGGFIRDRYEATLRAVEADNALLRAQCAKLEHGMATGTHAERSVRMLRTAATEARLTLEAALRATG